MDKGDVIALAGFYLEIMMILDDYESKESASKRRRLQRE